MMRGGHRGATVLSPLQVGKQELRPELDYRPNAVPAVGRSMGLVVGAKVIIAWSTRRDTSNLDC